jgi:protein gp37
MHDAHRMGSNPNAKIAAKYGGLTRLTADGSPIWTGEVRVLPELLELPMHWPKPALCFVNSMSDLFHESVPFEVVDAAHGVMARCPHIAFQILTKRPARMLEWATQARERGPIADCLAAAGIACPEVFRRPLRMGEAHALAKAWPLPNVWYGVSAGTQKAYDDFAPLLLRTPARIRFLSIEPLLEPMTIETWPDWVIIGGESGAKARACRIEWIADLVEQCRKAEVRCFVKQLGSMPIAPYPGWSDGKILKLKHGKGGDPAEWPEPIRVREYPPPVLS